MKKISGSEFKSMLISAGNNLYNYYPEIDALNVFPVPDGDTGTNMNLTFTSGIKEIANIHSANIGEIAKAFSRGLLMGARGNSGVILSQIFKGIANVLDGKEEVGAVTLAKAFANGKKVAYKAVMRPVEGTILTVVKESSNNLLKDVKHSFTIPEVMDHMVAHANESLAKTPELLPVLKEVGVVDSGGFGFVKILEGMQAYLAGKPIEKTTDLNENFNLGTETFIDNHEGQYGYCTEFIIKLDKEKDGYTEKKLRDFLEKIGNSIVVVEDGDIVKVHVHTLDPGKALSKAVTYGDLINLKIENMQEQAIKNPNIKSKEAKEVAIIAVSSGEGVNHMFSELRVDTIVGGGQTMNPSTQDFIAAIEELNAKRVIILPNNSNIVLAAQQARDVVKGVEVAVIESKTIIQGMVACINYNPEVSFKENVETMKKSLTDVKSGEVTYAIKDTKLNGKNIKKNDFMALAEKEVIATGKDKIRVVKKLIDYMIDEDTELVTLIYGEDVKKSEAEKLARQIENKKNIEVEVVDGQQPIYSFYIGVE